MRDPGELRNPTFASTTLPVSPAILPIETRAIHVQPPVLTRQMIELGQEKANQETESPVTLTLNEGPSKAKIRSLLEL